MFLDWGQIYARIAFKTGNLTHLYRNELDKFFFVHNAAYSDRVTLQVSLWDIFKAILGRFSKTERI